MSEKVKKLTSKQVLAIAELLEGKRIGVVADSVGVNPRTLNRWLNDELFMARLRKEELQKLERVGFQLVAMSGQAVDALEDVLNNPGQRGASVRRLCAKSILELLLKWREQLDFDTRLTNLERKVFNDW